MPDLAAWLKSLKLMRKNLEGKISLLMSRNELNCVGLVINEAVVILCGNFANCVKITGAWPSLGQAQPTTATSAKWKIQLARIGVLGYWLGF